MLQTAMNSEAYRKIYSVWFPILVVVMLLVVASLNTRPRMLGSECADFLIRICLSGWFCGLYIRLSRFSSYSHYPNIKWSKSDIGGIEKFFYIGLIFLFSLGSGVITYWVIRWFLPTLSGIAYVIAALNSLIVFIPMVTNYWVIKVVSTHDIY